MLRRSAFGSDHEIAVAGASVEQRKYVALSRLASGGGQQQLRNRNRGAAGPSDRIHVPISAAARQIAVRMIFHPLRKVGCELCVCHHSAPGRLLRANSAERQSIADRATLANQTVPTPPRACMWCSLTGPISVRRRPSRAGDGFEIRELPVIINRRIPQFVCTAVATRSDLDQFFFKNPARPAKEEEFTQLLSRPDVWIERIGSNGQFTPIDAPFNQDHDEWILLSRGSATLWGNGEHAHDPDDHLMIPARRIHRVTRTSMNEPTVRLRSIPWAVSFMAVV